MIRNAVLALFLFLLAWLAPAAICQDYYPLQTGNAWFYRDVRSADSAVTVSVRVVGDSLFSNGFRYFILNTEDIMGQRFVRADSTSVSYFTDGDHPVFRLDARVGDTTWLGWGPYAFLRLASIDTSLIFGIPERVLTYELDGLLYAVVKLTRRFGPVTEWRYGDPPPPWPDWGKELVGCMIDGVRYGQTLGVTGGDDAPVRYELCQNFPNPFNPETRVTYMLGATGPVVLRVFDIIGREIRTLVNQVQQSGLRSVTWDGRDEVGRAVASGLYLYQLRTPEFSRTRTMILLK